MAGMTPEQAQRKLYVINNYDHNRSEAYRISMPAVLAQEFIAKHGCNVHWQLNDDGTLSLVPVSFFPLD